MPIRKRQIEDRVLSDLQDVAIGAQADGDVLVFNLATGKWEPGKVATNERIAELVTELVDDFYTLDSVVARGNSTARNATFSGVLSAVGSFVLPIVAPAVLVAGSMWAVDARASGLAPVNHASLESLEDVSVSEKSDGQALVWNGTKWVAGTVATESVDLSNYYTKTDTDSKFLTAEIDTLNSVVSRGGTTDLPVAFTGTLKVPIVKPDTPEPGHVWAVDVVASGSAPVNHATLASLEDTAVGYQTNGQALIWDSVTGKWTPGTVAAEQVDLSNYYTKAESNGRYASLTGYNSANWDAAYGWGNHAGLYSASGHTHAYLPLSGGTLIGAFGVGSLFNVTAEGRINGNLTFNNGSAENNSGIIRGLAGRGLEFLYSSNGISWVTGATLNGSGNWNFTGNVGIGTSDVGLAGEKVVIAHNNINTLVLRNLTADNTGRTRTLFQYTGTLGHIANAGFIEGGGENSNSGYLSFHTSFGGSLAERMRIAANGTVSIPTGLRIPTVTPANPQPGDIWAVDAIASGSIPVNSYLALSGGTLTGPLAGTSFTDGYITWSAAQINRPGSQIELQYPGTGGIRVFGATATPIIFDNTNGSITGYGFVNASDVRLKDLIATQIPVDISALEAITYTWKHSGDKQIHIGYSAQDVQAYLPTAVLVDDKGFLSVNYTEVLVAKVAALEMRVKELEAN